MKRKYFTVEDQRAARRERAKRYRQKDPEAARVRERASYKRNYGSRAEYRDKRRRTKDGYVDRFLERAKKATPDTDIDREFLYFQMALDTCQLTKVPFNYARPGGATAFENPYSPSIDRIDSKKGYYKDNVHIVLSAVNFAKNAMSLQDFIDVWKTITKSWEALTS
ncbi:MAG: hypothetical protein IM557_10520 [Chitinophagaceae bacterium]|nr:hypothetical protein [Chitinophagaceae bacterium]